MKNGHKAVILGGLAVGAGAAVCWRWKIRMPLKEFTRSALYMAVLDDEICRIELIKQEKYKCPVQVKQSPGVAGLV